jgi:hypothetical protein
MLLGSCECIPTNAFVGQTTTECFIRCTSIPLKSGGVYNYCVSVKSVNSIRRLGGDLGSRREATVHGLRRAYPRSN